MTSRIRLGGPSGVKHPYAPSPDPSSSHEQMAQALDHIAVVLSAINHNLEALTATLTEMAARQGPRR